jgi:hypothetical protein
MRSRAWLVTTILLSAASALADPPPAPRPAPSASPPAPSPSGVRCSVSTPTGTFVAAFDFASMTGTVTADGAVGTRRFKIKAVPYAATYSLTFQAYGPGDLKLTSETMTKDKSVVARIVAFGDVNHLFFDSDYHPAVRATMDGFVCQ